ncbi:hypothetical protein, partial [Nitrosospira multiformis]|uniref:hypothetical protein n=1 Tax=Nitrosospira multiformis TaxID=1231 RepID=UPI001C63AAE2
QVKILVIGGNPRIADFHEFLPPLFRTTLMQHREPKKNNALHSPVECSKRDSFYYTLGMPALAEYLPNLNNSRHLPPQV